MVFLQCNLDIQDCPSLYPRKYRHDPPFTNQSCVRDARLDGNIGRCGFPGAPCIVDHLGGHDNCARKDYGICRNGVCGGGLGAACDSDNNCNFDINCNITPAAGPTVCGGAGALVFNNDPGLDFVRDYCMSGKSRSAAKYWGSNARLCDEGPFLAPTTPTTPSPSTTTSLMTSPSTNKGRTRLYDNAYKDSVAWYVGSGVGIVVFFSAAFLGFAFCVRRKARKTQAAAVSQGDGASTVEEPESQVPASQPVLYGRPYRFAEPFYPRRPSRPSRKTITDNPRASTLKHADNAQVFVSETQPSSSSPAVIPTTHGIEFAERRLLVLQDEVERGLSEIREHRKLMSK
ncbi:hypothetical protein B0H34DRAFT_711809 [Crassisporium funariophilum]|nr:hypothetical protein B0H34DRAFT_711809 [Crassisporium funariophilum]